jgi:multidrug efflux pump subunit AcrB
MELPKNSINCRAGKRSASRLRQLGNISFVIFLCVAALYESWTIPFANLLMLPLSLLGATLATSLRGLPNDVYFQIGILTTLGLSTKNAILIIQFARGSGGPREKDWSRRPWAR